MNTKNETLTRIEREAQSKFPDDQIHSLDLRAGYAIGYKAATDRAAPVVKALEDRLSEWEAANELEIKTVDLINNNLDSDETRILYPEPPEWVIKYRQIIETYKNDNV